MPVISQRTSGYLGNLLVVQANLAVTYHRLKMYEQALSLKLDVYSGMLRLHGEEHHQTLGAALNYANTLLSLRRFEEAKALLRKTIPVTRRALGENEEATLRMRWCFARAMGSVFVQRSPVDDVLASPSAVADASTAAVADDVRYVTLPVRAGAGAVASAAACAALLDEASMCTV